jgi:hypothetical protein
MYSCALAMRPASSCFRYPTADQRKRQEMADIVSSTWVAVALRPQGYRCDFECARA